MGRGVPNNIFRRVAKDFLNRKLPTEASDVASSKKDYMNCTKTKSRDDPECVRLEQIYNQAVYDNRAYMKHIHNLRLNAKASYKLIAPPYQRDIKGPKPFAKGIWHPWSPFEYRNY